MDIKQIQQLAALMQEKQLSSLEICEGENKITLVRDGSVSASAPQATPQLEVSPALPPTAQPVSPAPLPGDVLVSPLVGIGYHAPSPDDKPYVAVGQQVKKGDILCLLEAMKLMNEFPSPRDGVIAEICFENGALVEFSQPLFRLT